MTADKDNRRKKKAETKGERRFEREITPSYMTLPEPPFERPKPKKPKEKN